MTFDKQAEFNELEFHIELIFKSGNDPSDVISLGPSAYIAMVTTEEMSFDALRAQVEYIKGALDARLGEAKARFAAAVS
jgi:hypothetical protein